MVDLIVAVNQINGIGAGDKIPWVCKEDLKLFAELTKDSIVIVGRKTAETLPRLKNRTVYCISSRGILKTDENSCKIFNSIHSAIISAKQEGKHIFIAGGSQLYQMILSSMPTMINRIYISRIQNNIPCDKFFPVINSQSGWMIEKRVIYTDFIHEIWTRGTHPEQQYLELLNRVSKQGIVRSTRNGEVKSLFFHNLHFNLLDGFPLLTTKKMFFRGILEELLFFIRGDTDSKLLEEKGVNIWKGNTSRSFLDNAGFNNRKEGIMGPLYGYQWRFFNARYNEETGEPLERGIDQLQYVIDTIKNDPTSRRIIMTDYNPEQVSECVLYPCHSILIQFYVEDNYLDMYCYNRSQDTFLGTPFNIASSALFLTIIASICDLIPRNLYMGLGDIHIYDKHYQLAEDQLKREPYPFPRIKLLRKLTDIDDIRETDFELVNYQSHPAIKTEMVA